MFPIFPQAAASACGTDFLAVEGEQDGQQHDADHKGHRDQGQTGLHIVLELVAAQAHDHGIGGHADGGGIGAGAGDDGGDDHGAGVSTQALGKRGGDGHHQGGGSGVGHEVGQCAANREDDHQQDHGVGVGAQSAHDGIGNEAACAGGFQRLGQGQGAAEQQDDLQIDGLQSFLLGDNAGEHQNNGADAGGDLDLDADLFLEDHGQDDNDQDDQGDDLLPGGHTGVVLGGLGGFAAVGAVGQQLVADDGIEDDAQHQHGNAHRCIHEEAGGNAHFLQGIHAHQVAGCADDGQVAAQSGSEDQGHQQAGAGVAGLIGNAADHGDQHGGGAGVGQEAGHNANDGHNGHVQHSPEF